MSAAPEKSPQASSHAAAGPVKRAGIQITQATLKILPGPISRRLQTEAGNRFARFVPVAIAALASSQITLAVLYNAFHITAGKAALCASIVGAGVSYLLSRWAWERKGRPDLLRETVPFWLVSLAAWTILSLTSHYASSWAKSEGLGGFERALVVNGAYLFANCFTFVSRFLIFHYILFKNRGPKSDEAQPADGGTEHDSEHDPEPMPALTGDSSSQRKPRN
jgi:putative flippase GtrA